MAEQVYIYRIYFPINDKCYIGQTQDLQRRMKEHLRSDSLICQALYKYDDWQVSVLHTCKTRDEANRIEIEEIRNFKAVTPNGYNRTAGGAGGIEHTEAAKYKISKSLHGHAVSDSTRLKIGAAQIGMRNGCNNPFYGKNHSEETKEKNRQAHIGKKQSKTTTLKIMLTKYNNGLAKLKADLNDKSS